MNKENWYLSIFTLGLCLGLLILFFAGILYGGIYSLFLLCFFIVALSVVFVYLYLRIQHNIDSRFISLSKNNDILKDKINESKKIQEDLIDFLENLLLYLEKEKEILERGKGLLDNYSSKSDKMLEKGLEEIKEIQRKFAEGNENMMDMHYNHIQESNKKIMQELENHKKEITNIIKKKAPKVKDEQ